MPSMVTNALHYDWETWFMGLMRALFSGVGGSMTGLLGPMATDPDHFNLGAGLHHTLISMGIGFLIGGGAQLGLFLKTHGAPDLVGPIQPPVVKP